MNTHEVYDPMTNIWSSAAPIPTARRGLMAVALDGKLWVVGGVVDALPTPTGVLQVYDPATNTWETKAPMPTPRYGAGIGVIAGRIHVAGGLTAIAFVATHEVYDPMTNAWTTDAPMPSPRSQLVAGVVNSTLFAAGGFNGITNVDTLEAFTGEGVPPPGPVGVNFSLHPRSLKLSSQGNFVTGYITVAPPDVVTDLNGASVRVDKINGNSISPLAALSFEFQDQDGDGVLETLMAKFNRAALAGLLGEGLNSVSVAASFSDGRAAAGSDTIRGIK
jgi:hypothetical protein